MKRAINSAALILLVACATAPRVPANRYGLKVVPDVATYERLVAIDTEKRLVDLQTFIPGIAIDIRYATTNNFMHQQLYPIAKAYLRQPAAAALHDVQGELAKDGLGLKIFDAYRPYGITEKMWERLRRIHAARPAGLRGAGSGDQKSREAARRDDASRLRPAPIRVVALRPSGLGTLRVDERAAGGHSEPRRRRGIWAAESRLHPDSSRSAALGMTRNE
jgi:D-Ala-D-Ala dipeptidase-like protein